MRMEVVWGGVVDVDVVGAGLGRAVRRWRICRGAGCLLRGIGGRRVGR